MQGEVLGYDVDNDKGVIIVNETRYAFDKAGWREQTMPQKGMRVDFVAQNGRAEDIYIVSDRGYENSVTILGVLSLAITFFLGFVGTLISRLAISKQSLSEAAMPVFIHFVITVFAVIPVIGWLVYVIGTIYYMVQNYKLVVEPQEQNKYA
jgi:hypothetical protein